MQVLSSTTLTSLSNCELCLIFKKGKIPTPRGSRNIQQLVRIPRTEHSRKPIEVLHKIEEMFPTQNRFIMTKMLEF